MGNLMNLDQHKHDPDVYRCDGYYDDLNNHFAADDDSFD